MKGNGNCMCKKVSIIIPVYNAEKFLDRCIQSVLDQTYQNVELVLINDGSTDQSLKKIKKYEKKYKNIIVFTQKNKGAGEARNKGINVSTGDYITFVDADDYIEDDYVENLISKSNNMDIVICGYQRYDTNNNLIFKKVPYGIDIDYFRFISTICKLYRKDFIVENIIYFSNRRIGEDILFTLKCYSLTDKIEKIYYAIPSATVEEKREILNICNETDCKIKQIPGIYQLINGDVAVKTLRDVTIEDLLDRDTIKLDMTEVYEMLKNKVVMVTGGGGSIGSELCRQIAKHQPKELIIFEIYENNAYAIEQELRRKYPDLNLTVLIGLCVTADA